MKENLTSATRDLEEMIEICLSSRRWNVDFFLLLTSFHESLHKYSLIILMFLEINIRGLSIYNQMDPVINVFVWKWETTV